MKTISLSFTTLLEIKQSKINNYNNNKQSTELPLKAEDEWAVWIVFSFTEDVPLKDLSTWNLYFTYYRFQGKELLQNSYP